MADPSSSLSALRQRIAARRAADAAPNDSAANALLSASSTSAAPWQSELAAVQAVVPGATGRMKQLEALQNAPHATIPWANFLEAVQRDRAAALRSRSRSKEQVNAAGMRHAVLRLYLRATRILPITAANRHDSTYLKLWLDLISIQAEDPDSVHDARSTFKLVKVQRIGLDSPALYLAWAELEEKVGNFGKALKLRNEAKSCRPLLHNGSPSKENDSHKVSSFNNGMQRMYFEDGSHKVSDEKGLLSKQTANSDVGQRSPSNALPKTPLSSAPSAIAVKGNNFVTPFTGRPPRRILGTPNVEDLAPSTSPEQVMRAVSKDVKLEQAPVVYSSHSGKDARDHATEKQLNDKNVSVTEVYEENRSAQNLEVSRTDAKLFELGKSGDRGRPVKDVSNDAGQRTGSNPASLRHGGQDQHPPLADCRNHLQCFSEPCNPDPCGSGQPSSSQFGRPFERAKDVVPQERFGCALNAYDATPKKSMEPLERHPGLHRRSSPLSSHIPMTSVSNDHPSDLQQGSRMPPHTEKRTVLDSAADESNSSSGMRSQHDTLSVLFPYPPKENTIAVNSKPYLVLELVGKGGSSKVYKVLSSDMRIFALKRVRVAESSRDALTSYANEIKLLEDLRGQPTIIQLYDAEVLHSVGVIHLIMEYGDIDLAKLLARRKGKTLNGNCRRLYWQQMLEAVNTIHTGGKHKIIHGDLKPANFLHVTGTLKLIDFGIAKAVQTDDTTKVVRDSQVGTPNYMSPEALMAEDDTQDDESFDHGFREPSNRRCRYTVGRASDIWSLGCILYQMVYGRTPFAHIKNTIHKLNCIQDPTYEIAYPESGNMDPNLLHVLRGCLQRDPSKRLTMESLLSHPYICQDSSLPSRIPASTTQEHVRAVLEVLEEAGCELRISPERSAEFERDIVERVVRRIHRSGAKNGSEDKEGLSTSLYNCRMTPTSSAITGYGQMPTRSR